MKIDCTEKYINGQMKCKIEKSTLTYYYKNGNIKAQGLYIKSKMEGEWQFFRENGALWQVGHFKDEKKHGKWIRYNKENVIEYDEEFVEGKQL